MLTRDEVEEIGCGNDDLDWGDAGEHVDKLCASLIEAMEALEHRLTASHAEAERCAECAAAEELVAKWKGEK